VNLLAVLDYGMYLVYFRRPWGILLWCRIYGVCFWW